MTSRCAPTATCSKSSFRCARTRPRSPLWPLAIRLDRQGKQKLQLYIGQSVEAGPLSAWHWNPTIMGSTWMIGVDEEARNLSAASATADSTSYITPPKEGGRRN